MCQTIRVRQMLGMALAALLQLSSLSSVADNPVWIDVRSASEHAADSIEGDPRIDWGSIAPQVLSRYPDKSTEIHLYCAAGGRAGRAADALRAAGYTNVSNAGGIDDARRARGLDKVEPTP